MPSITFELPDSTEKTLNAPTDWTLMEIARRADIDGVVAECGGGAICGTCHVVLEPSAYDRLPTPEPTEQALLELVPHREPTSRLACQVIVVAALDGMRVKVPSEQMAM
jgi:ferredoxin, 2Fe-2S